jgi:hypothetical protein
MTMVDDGHKLSFNSVKLPCVCFPSLVQNITMPHPEGGKILLDHYFLEGLVHL